MDSKNVSDGMTPLRGRGLRLRPTGKRVGWAVIWLITLVALWYAEENFRGHRAWERYAAEMKARGESLDPEAALPPVIPDEENFAASPLFQPLFEVTTVQAPGDPWPTEYKPRDPERYAHLSNLQLFGPKPPKEIADAWGTGGREVDNLEMLQKFYRQQPDFPKNREPASPGEDVLLALSKYDPEVALLREAGKRPKSRFPIRYADTLMTPLPHVSLITNLGNLLKIRAIAHLSIGQQDAAFDEVMLALRLADSLHGEPSIISSLVYNNGIGKALLSLGVGLTKHQWGENQLAQMDARLAAENLIAEGQVGIRGERNVAILPLLEVWRSNPKHTVAIRDALHTSESRLSKATFLAALLQPRGWYDLAKVELSRAYEDVLTWGNAKAKRVYPDRQAASSSMEKRLGVISSFLYPSFKLPQTRLAHGQASIHLARVAIALERHRLKRGKYPDSLDALDPGLIDSANGLPLDPASGSKPHYTLIAPDHYKLYYDGWNGKDDGGKEVWTNSTPPARDFTQGDWVWGAAGS